MSPQGAGQETGWIVKARVAHDLYHSGEIAHFRALRQGDDFQDKA
jgi:hypothetical protein